MFLLIDLLVNNILAFQLYIKVPAIGLRYYNHQCEGLGTHPQQENDLMYNEYNTRYLEARCNFYLIEGC